jgi:23S rRNA pseudouridine2605 synthase
MLNKPKGYVTTVSDPEKRPTVVDFFAKMRERLYPVGRLDYLSEGLLLMTNDGELANLLTRASSGVEKTYLVKIAGLLTEEELDRLRGGVSIEREEEGSARVRTAPASVRLIRPGDNPWYEVVLIEGRNREIRKMFSACGHFVEKIRRVGYGPLILDLEPGLFRELSTEELNALRLTAEGKMKPRRPKTPVMLPKEAGKPARSNFRGDRREGSRPRSDARGPRENKPFSRPSDRDSAPSRSFEKRPFTPREDRGGAKPFGSRPPFPPRRDENAARGAGFASGPRKFDRPRDDRGGAKPFGTRPPRPFGDRPDARFNRRPDDRPATSRPPQDRTPDTRSEARPPRPFGSRPGGSFGSRPGAPSSRPPFAARSGERRPFTGSKPRWDRELRPPRSDAPDRPGREFSARPPREQSSGEARPPRREFRPREEGAGRAERPNRFGPPRSDRPPGRGPAERGPASGPRFGGPGGRPSGSGRPSGPGRSSGPGRPSGMGRPSGPGRPGGPGRSSGGPRRPGPGGRPGGFSKPGFGGKPGGSPRGRG